MMKPRPNPRDEGYWIYGRKPVIEALRAGTGLSALLILESAQGEIIHQIQTLAAQRGIPVRYQSAERMDQIIPGVRHQGVLARLQPQAFRYVDPEAILHYARERREPPAVGILDQITDPHNLGAIIRSAVAAGFHGLIIPKHHAAEVNSVVIKTSAGTALACRIARVTNIVQTMKWLKDQNLWIYGTSAGAEKTIYQQNYKTPTAVVIGSEGHGMRRLVEAHCDFLVRIPIAPEAESLNASVAAGILFFEVRRQRFSP